MSDAGIRALILVEAGSGDRIARLCAEEWLVPDRACDAREAIARLSTTDYAVIILELEGEGIDEIGVLEFLRSTRPALFERVVLFTGFSSEIPAQLGLPAVPKSDLASLRYAIRRVVGSNAETN